MAKRKDKSELERFAAKLGHSAAGRESIKKAIADVKAARVMSEDEFFQRLAAKRAGDTAAGLPAVQASLEDVIEDSENVPEGVYALD